MNISAINAYKQSYVNYDTGRTENTPSVKNTEKTSVEKASISSENMRMEDPENIVTKSEREFFVKMFPENQEQIENHKLFNSRGQVMTPNLSKGSIIDGRV